MMFDELSATATAPTELVADPRGEALARLDYLLHRRFGCGVVLGRPGSGKSALLNEFHASLRRYPCTACLIDASHCDEDRLLWELAAQLGLGQSSQASLRALRVGVLDHLLGLLAGGGRLVLLLDQADALEESGVHALVRLIRVAEASAGMTLIWATRRPVPVLLRGALLPLTDLRIDLEPLTVAQTQTYVRRRWENEAAAPAFDPAALALIERRTKGEPRRIDRLCRLAQLAALADDESRISAEMVEAAAMELP